jgi:hypothetical protein
MERGPAFENVSLMNLSEAKDKQYLHGGLADLEQWLCS